MQTKTYLILTLLVFGVFSTLINLQTGGNSWSTKKGNVGSSNVAYTFVGLPAAFTTYIYFEKSTNITLSVTFNNSASVSLQV
jgi:hypothetical protein